MDPRLSALLDQQDIRDVVYRYCRGIDRRDFDLVRRCYHEDGTDDHGSFSGGADAFVEWVEGLTARYRFTMHLVGQIFVEFEEVDPASPGLAHDSPDAPKMPNVAAAETVGVSIHRSDESKPYLNLATGFRYLDRFERRGGTWKIASRKALGEWSIQLPSDAWWELPEAQIESRRDQTDPLYALLSSLGTTKSRNS